MRLLVGLALRLKLSNPRFKIDTLQESTMVMASMRAGAGSFFLDHGFVLVIEPPKLVQNECEIWG
jgi:hypothetical protein